MATTVSTDALFGRLTFIANHDDQPRSTTARMINSAYEAGEITDKQAGELLGRIQTYLNEQALATVTAEQPIIQTEWLGECSYCGREVEIFSHTDCEYFA